MYVYGKNVAIEILNNNKKIDKVYQIGRAS